MATPAWPAADKRELLGQRISREDGPVKCTGQAKYAYDMNPKGLLYAKCLGSAHPSAVVKAIDTSEAERSPGVAAVWVDEMVLDPNTPFRVQYAGQIIAAVAAATEEQAIEAVRKIKVTYEPQPFNLIDTDPSLAEPEPKTEESEGVAKAFQEAEVVSEGYYGIPVVAHCCLEAHGQTCSVENGELKIWPSTQSVSRFPGGLGYTAGIAENKITVDCQYMGGGFGSKFGPDKWGDISVHLSEKAGRPVKLMLERDLEMMVAGNRPSAYANVRIAAKKDGTVTAWESEVWGSAGMGNYGGPRLPYVFTKIPETKTTAKNVKTNRGSTRAWRAPNHPQGCFITMTAMDDLAAKLGMDALEFFKKAAELTDRPEVYREELDIAAEMIGYGQKAHLRGESGPGPIKRGLGVSIHTWAGQGHEAQCDVTINPDGSVKTDIGTQDLGTGTRTVVDMVVSETLGIPMDRVNVSIGNSKLPPGNASGGSSTVGGVSAACLLAATAALNRLFEKAAPQLGVSPDKLEAYGGAIRVADDPSKSMPWDKACALLGAESITERGHHKPTEGLEMGLINRGVGGAQIADVSVDVETGLVRINEIAAVQDCGLVINQKTAESQIYGGLIMGITYALFEEAVYDPVTGRMLNPNMEFYKLAGLADVGSMKVRLMMDETHQSRGVIGLGEPPVISPGAAISNAVANAIGVRVPHLPLTPYRVLAALAGGGTNA